ncbi:MAG: succinylarginine dihydrolase [Arenicella sp.]|jgi:succinylarginine dihydrolase
MSVFEVNFDGLVGPSHHYAGLSKGNIASEKNAMAAANPRAAALQGLEKMRSLSKLGIPQGVFAPHLRPNLEILRTLGFTGSDSAVLDKAWSDAPDIVSKCYSASPMWTANAATVSPAADTADGKTHFTAANLCRMFHRSYESKFTSRLLQTIFSDEQHFQHHDALPAGHFFGDEGAANHTRLAENHGAQGLEFFVYGETAFDTGAPRPINFPARQSKEASQAIARLHGLNPNNTVFAQQNPDVIDAGVFHNDVIAVGTTSLLFYHQAAFLNSEKVIEEIKQKYQGDSFYALEVKDSEVSVQDAIQTYLFNTQLLDCSESGGSKQFLLIAPTECEENPAVADYLASVVASLAPIKEVRYFDLRESMKNGGGPACLRLRVALSQAQIDSIQPRVLLNDALYNDLKLWIERHYRDRLSFEDLRDPKLVIELKAAAAELEPILGLTGIYQL